MNGRSPNLVNTTGSTYTVEQGSILLDSPSTGKLVVSGQLSGNARAVIPLPAVTLSDIISVEAVIRPQGPDTPSNWIGIGFIDESGGDVPTNATAWAWLFGGTHTHSGLLIAASGPGTVGSIFARVNAAGYQGPLNASTLKLTYTVSTGNVKVELGSTIHSNDNVRYNGLGNTPVPLTALKRAFLAYRNTNRSASGSDAGYIDYYKVSYL